MRTKIFPKIQGSELLKIKEAETKHQGIEKKIKLGRKPKLKIKIILN